MGGELAGVVALDDGDERLEHVARAVGVRVEEGAEQLAVEVVAFAPVPGAQVAGLFNELKVVVDDRLNDLFQGVDEDYFRE